jgi:hypothetical protein
MNYRLNGLIRSERVFTKIWAKVELHTIFCLRENNGLTLSFIFATAYILKSIKIIFFNMYFLEQNR